MTGSLQSGPLTAKLYYCADETFTYLGELPLNDDVGALYRPARLQEMRDKVCGTETEMEGKRFLLFAGVAVCSVALCWLAIGKAQTASASFQCPKVADGCQQDPKDNGKTSYCGSVSCGPRFKGKFSRDWAGIRAAIDHANNLHKGLRPLSEAFDTAKRAGLKAQWGLDRTADSYGETDGYVEFFDPVTNQMVAVLGTDIIIEHFPPPPKEAGKGK
jgi:hypothetical protein